MKVTLSPALEELVKQDVQRGPYRSVEEFVEQAVSMLHEQESWLAEHKAEIEQQIEQGYASAQRGELIDADQVRSEMQERKRAWFARQKR